MPDKLSFFLIMAATDGLYAESFLHELKQQGHRVVVLTRTAALGYDWPRDQIDAIYAVNDIFDAASVQNAVSYLARSERIDRLIGPGEYDIELAAAVREHLRVGGMGETTARYFRDKLAMRERATAMNIKVPAFIGTIHHPAIARFLAQVPGPWVLKPRMAASSKGIKVLREANEVWEELAKLGDAASNHLIERFTPGHVFHVDGVVSGRQVLFASAHRYGRPILDLHTNGGVYTTWRIGEETAEAQALFALNRRVVEAFGLAAGVFHIEYIQGQDDGEFYFLEASARVGAGLIEEMVEAESGVNLWREWVRLEVGQVHPPYAIVRPKDVYAGVLASATPHERPDPRPYMAPDVTPLASKPYHLALLVTGPTPEAVQARLQEISARVGQELMIQL